MYTMYQLSNGYVDHLGDNIGEDGVFKVDYVRQLETARDSLFIDICETVHVQDFDKLRAVNLKRAGKERLLEWLETACCLLERFTLPLLNNACSLTETLSQMKDEKIADQKAIIDLQAQLIEKRDKECEEVKETVETGMKGYSTVLQQCCEEALAPAKISQAINKVTRSKNIVIYGVAEQQGQVLKPKILEILGKITESPQIRECHRIGRPSPGSVRPIKVILASPDQAYQVLRKAKTLREVEGFGSVYVCPDRSQEERKNRKILVEQLKFRKQAQPYKSHFIRLGEIVSVQNESAPKEETHIAGVSRCQRIMKETGSELNDMLNDMEAERTKLGYTDPNRIPIKQFLESIESFQKDKISGGFNRLILSALYPAEGVEPPPIPQLESAWSELLPSLTEIRQDHTRLCKLRDNNWAAPDPPKQKTKTPKKAALTKRKGRKKAANKEN